MHRVMIHPASYKTCRKAVDRAFELFPQKIAGKKTEDTQTGVAERATPAVSTRLQHPSPPLYPELLRNRTGTGSAGVRGARPLIVAL